MNQAGKVYIVHCIDTEGPLSESIEATFDRIRYICDLDLPPTPELLSRLQSKEIDLHGLEESVYQLVRPDLITTNRTWSDIDRMLGHICRPEYRRKYTDSYNNGLVYNWFVLDHSGYSGVNPRDRDTRSHSVFDFYSTHSLITGTSDLIGWHYHPLPINSNLHCSGNTFLNSSDIFDQLCKKLIERSWFPSVYRPGFHTERPDLSWFLEQWIPFDYANQSGKSPSMHSDLGNHRFGDWDRAPISWKPYHPSHDDYQRPGTCRRWIARCLNMNSRIRQLSREDIVLAFQESQLTGKSILSFTNHDFRNMAGEIESTYQLIESVRSEYPNVSTVNCNALEAFRLYLNINSDSIDSMSTELLQVSDESHILKVATSRKVFGPQPFLAIKLFNNKYTWKNFDFVSETEWSFTFDWQDVLLSNCKNVCIAAPFDNGKVCVDSYDLTSGSKSSRVLND